MGNFFYTPKPKKFEIKPRYWNPEKEEREARERRIKAELGKEDGDSTYVPHIKGEFRKGLSKGKWSAGSEQRRRSNVRVLIIIAIIVALVYWIFN